MKRRALLLAGTAAAPWRTSAAPPRTVLAIRHAATEPGVGDPPGFLLDRCETQRNLSPAGREQALAFGRRLVAMGWRPQAVFSSRWCRCRDTAALIIEGLGAAPRLAVTPWTALDSTFGARDRQAAQTATVVERLRRAALPPQLWVTHQVNLTALTGRAIAMGEAVWLATARDGAVLAQPFDP